MLDGVMRAELGMQGGEEALELAGGGAIRIGGDDLSGQEAVLAGAWRTGSGRAWRKGV